MRTIKTSVNEHCHRIWQAPIKTNCCGFINRAQVSILSPQVGLFIKKCSWFMTISLLGNSKSKMVWGSWRWLLDTFWGFKRTKMFSTYEAESFLQRNMKKGFLKFVTQPSEVINFKFGNHYKTNNTFKQWHWNCQGQKHLNSASPLALNWQFVQLV